MTIIFTAFLLELLHQHGQNYKKECRIESELPNVPSVYLI